MSPRFKHPILFFFSLALLLQLPDTRAMEVQRRNLISLPPLPRPPLDLLLPSSSTSSRNAALLDPQLPGRLSNLAVTYSRLMESQSRDGSQGNYPVAISRLNFKGGGQDNSETGLYEGQGSSEDVRGSLNRRDSHPGKVLERMVILSKHPKVVEVSLILRSRALPTFPDSGDRRYFDEQIEIKHHAAVLVVKNRNSPELVVEVSSLLQLFESHRVAHHLVE